MSREQGPSNNLNFSFFFLGPTGEFLSHDKKFPSNENYLERVFLHVHIQSPDSSESSIANITFEWLGISVNTARVARYFAPKGSVMTIAMTKTADLP